MDGALAAIAAVVGAVVTAAVTYLVARRQSSGTVGTSQADLLWKEAAAIRTEYRTRIEQLEAQILTLHAENTDMKMEVVGLRNENTDLKAQVILLLERCAEVNPDA